MIRYVAAALLAGMVLASAAQAGKFNKKVSIGDAAPSWSDLPGTDGKKHSLADLKDKDVVVVVITCNHCPVAQAYEDRLVAFARKYADKKVAVVAISVSHEDEDSMAKMKERAKEKDFPFPYVHDDSQKIGRQLGASVTPQIFMLDKDRKIVYMGTFDDDLRASKAKEKYLEVALTALLKGEKIALSETRPSGCGITYEAKK